MRALYEWTAFTGASDLTNHTTVANTMIPLFTSTGITDVLVFLKAVDYDNNTADVLYFLQQCSAAGINVWGLEGYRGYFDDSGGAQSLYAAAERMVSWNQTNSANAQFVGFWTDMECQDGQGVGTSCFHNGSYDGQLSNQPGTGVWKPSAAQDRMAICQNWMDIQSRVRKIVNDNGLRFGAAMSNWTEDYFGQPVTFPWRGVTRSAGQHMMSFMGAKDVYGIMSYSTTVSHIEAKLNMQVGYSLTIPAASRPILTVGVETNPNNGDGTVSYGSSLTKNHHASVLADIATVISDYPSLGGSTINDYYGWNLMPA